MHLYLDLDGVIIRAADTVAGIELAPHAVEFLRWATDSALASTKPLAVG
jgi:hypothetical protein